MVMAKLVVFDLDKGASIMIYVAKWLKNLSEDITKNAKKESKQKLTKTPIYAKRFIAKLYK